MIQIVTKRVGELPRTKLIDGSLEAMQKEVGGYIEAYPLTENLVVICNEMGRLAGLRPNVELYGKDEVIFGDFFVCDTLGEDFVGLTDTEAKAVISYLKRCYEL